MNEQGFTPAQGGTLTYAGTGASVNQVITVGAAMQEVMVQSAGGGVANVRFGTSTQTAVATDFPVLPGAIYLMTIGNANNVAVLAPSGTTVYVTPCEGS
jgi:hypothetical protein